LKLNHKTMKGIIRYHLTCLALFLLVGINTEAQQVNLALNASVSQTSGGTGTFGPTNYNDNVITPFGGVWGWVGTNGSIEYVWSQPQNINKIVFYKDNRPFSTMNIEYWNGSSYVTLFGSYTGTTSSEDSIIFPTIITSRVRFANIGGSSPNFREIQVIRGSVSNNDIGVITIDSLTNVCTTAPLPLLARVMNYGRNRVTSFEVNWSINGALQLPVSWSGLLDTTGGVGSSSVVVPFGTYAFSGAFSTIKAWTSQPNLVADTVRINDTFTIVKNAAFATGTYTIGGINPDFISVSDAWAALKIRGICGPVTFLIRSGIYTEQLAFDQEIQGANAINTVTFLGQNRNNTIIDWTPGTNTTARHTILINASKFLVFRNLTVQGQGNAPGNTSYTLIINGTATDIKIRNCNIRVTGDDASSSTSTNYIPILLGGNSANYNNQGKVDRIEIDSNTITNGWSGFFHTSSSTANSEDNTFRHNIVNNTVQYGYYVNGTTNPNVSFNKIEMRNVTSTSFAIYILSANPSLGKFITVNSNTITRFGLSGISLINSNSPASPKSSISNNAIGGENLQTNSYGIQIQNSNGLMIYHNSIQLTLPGSTSTISAPLYIASGASISVINNHFSRNSSGLGLAMHVNQATSIDTMDYNNFYRPDTATGLIFIGATRFPFNFRGYLGFNTNSYNRNPDFIGLKNLNTLNPCNNGIPLAAIPTDINGTPRNTTAPDLGAYELPSTNNDLQVTEITNLGTPLTPGLRDFVFRIRNNGANTINTFEASYVHNGSLPNTQFISQTLSSCDTFSVNFTSGQQISIVNINEITAYVASPNGGIDSNRVNDTLKQVRYLPLDGTYTIGGLGANFNTVSQAMSTLQLAGIAGPTEFVIQQGIYNERVNLIGPINGHSSATPITIRGVAQNLVTIENSILNQAVFTINGVNYVTVRDLTVLNYASTGTCLAVIGSLSSNAGTGTRIANCRLQLPNFSTGAGFNILITSNPNGFSTSQVRSDSISIDSNILQSGNQGFVMFGAGNIAFNRGILIRNNQFTNHNSFGLYLLSAFNPFDILSNRFNLNNGQGIFISNCQHSNTSRGHVIAYNRVWNYGQNGIYIANSSSNSLANAPNLIFNNFVVSTTNANTSYGIGVFDLVNSRTWVYHNNVLQQGLGTVANNACFFSSGSAQVQVKNNIFSTITGAHIPANFNTIPIAGNVNHNIYHNTSNSTLVRIGTNVFNSSNFKTSTAGGDSSYNINPDYKSNTDLHVESACIPKGLDLTWLIPLDIDSVSRVSPPMIGADELFTFSNDLQVLRLLTPSIPVDTGLQEVKVVVKNAGNTFISSFNTSYRLGTSAIVSIAYAGLGLQPCEIDTITFTGTNRVNVPNGVNSFKVYTSNPNFSTDGNSDNDTVDLLLKTPMSGTYVLGVQPSDYFDINDALADAKTRGISGPVTLAIKSGVYINNYILDDIPGMDANNVITITSQAGHRDSVQLQFASAATMPPQVFTITGKYYNIENLTIRQLNGFTSNRVLFFSGSPSNIIINNCVIWGPIFGVDGTNTQSYTVFSSGQNCNNLTFTNNYFKGSYFGFALVGLNTTYSVKNVQIENNLFDSAAFGSLYALQYSANCRIVNNTMIHRVVFSTVTTSQQLLQYNDTGFVFSGNRIQTIGPKNLNFQITFSRNSVLNPAVYTNNIFNASSSTMNLVIGPNALLQNLIFANNTVHVGNGNIQLQNPVLFVGVRFINNIVVGNGATILQYSSTPTSPSQLEADHNFYFSYSSNNFINLSGTGRSLGLFKQIMPGFEQNSVSYRPSFTSLTNLIPNPNDTSVWLLNGRASRLTQVPVDINGIVRPATGMQGAPDIGAFEVTPSATTLSPIIFPVPAIPAVGITQHFVLGEDTVARIHWDSISVQPSQLFMRYYPSRIPDTQGATGIPAHATYELFGSGVGRYTITQCFKPTLLGNILSVSNVRSSGNFGAGWNSNIGTLSTVYPLSNFCTTPNRTQLNGIYTLTDNTSPLANFIVINKQPQAIARCVGDSGLFITEATGSGITYQWQEWIGGTWTNMLGATNDTLIITAINSLLNGRQYRCVIGSTSGSAFTQQAMLTVGTSTTITSQPISVSNCVGENAVFTVTASGTQLNYQWERNTGSGYVPISGANQPSYTQSFVTSGMNNHQFRCLVSGVCGNIISSPATLNVNSVLTIISQPQPTQINACVGGSATAWVSASGATQFQWQINTGTGFQNIVGALDDTLQLSNIPSSYQGATIRCAIANSCDLQFSNSVNVAVETPGIWTGNVSTSWNTAANWGCGQLPNLTTNVIIPSLAARMPELTSSVFVNNLTIQTGASVVLRGSNSVLNIVGNFVNNGSLIDSGGLMVMNGIAPQTLNAGNYNGKLRINSANNVTLANNLLVNDSLQFTNGRIILGAFNITIGNSGLISGASSNMYIVTNGSGTLTINNIGLGGKSSAVLFPVGHNTANYNPITITNTSTADNYSVRAQNGAYRNYINNVPVLSTQVTSSVVGVSWIVNEALAGGSNATIDFQWNINQELSGFIRLICYITRYNGTNWLPGSTGLAGGPFVGPYTRSLAGITSFGVFNVASGTTLPVEMVDFTAKAASSSALLNWTTAAEINNKHFVVQRSSDNMNFINVTKIASLAPNGYSTRALSYSFVDDEAKANSANNTIYYRLVQVDIDGSEYTSTSIAVSFTDAKAQIAVAPNPFSHNFTVYAGEVGNHTVVVTDITGKVMFSKEVKNANSIQINEMSELSAGIYFVTLDDGTAIKVIKQ